MRCRPLRHRYAIPTLAGIALVIPQAAHADQPRVPIDVVEKPLTIGARIDVNYDANVVQGNAEAARLRGLEKGEIITTPSATVDFGYRTDRLGASFNGVFGYDFHTKNKVLDRERIDFGAGATQLVGDACAISGKLNFLRKQTRQSDLTTIVTNNTVKLTIATLGQTCVTSGGLIETVQVLRSSWHNSSRDNINNDRRAVSGLIGYTDTKFGTLGVTGLFEATDFSGRPPILVMTPDTLEKTQVGLQYTSPVDRPLSGSLSAGYVYSRAKISPGSRLAGKLIRKMPVLQAALVWKPNDKLRISALAARRIRHDTSFTITTDFQLGVDYTLSPRLQASVGGRWLRDHYYGRDVTLPRIAQDWQNQTTFYATLTRQIAPRTELAADLRYDRGLADFAPFTYKGARFTLTLTSAFEVPIR